LDEIGDLPLFHQAKILRALEDQKIRPVGATREVSINARIIAATNRDLYSMVQAGHFREDLYYRLCEFPIRIPALKERAEDISALAQHFWRKITQDEKHGLKQEILDELQSMPWPGNARELKTVLSTLHAFFRTTDLRVEHLRAVLELQGHPMRPRGQAGPSRKIGLQRMECLGHLRRAEEVIRAVEVALRPLAGDGRPDDQSVAALREQMQFRMSELELLCSRPSLFSTEAAFSEVHRFRGTLLYFQSLLQEDVKAAQQYVKTDLSGSTRRAQEYVAKEIKRLLDHTS
jgi:DNA-binding NtrC family response regulator